MTRAKYRRRKGESVLEWNERLAREMNGIAADILLTIDEAIRTLDKRITKEAR